MNPFMSKCSERADAFGPRVFSFLICDFSRAITFISPSPYGKTIWCSINGAVVATILSQQAAVMQISLSTQIFFFWQSHRDVGGTECFTFKLEDLGFVNSCGFLSHFSPQVRRKEVKSCGLHINYNKSKHCSHRESERSSDNWRTAFISLVLN